MKLSDPKLSAFVDAYREQTRPSPEVLRQIEASLTTRPRQRKVWPWIAAASLAAGVVLWLVVGGMGGPIGLMPESTPSSASDQVRTDEPRAAAPESPRRTARPVSAPPAVASPTPAVEAPPSPSPVRPRSLVDERPSVGSTDAWRSIDAAERALAEGQPAVALRELDLHAREFPNADLRQERRALRVLALCALGRTTEGRGQRATFLRDFPDSTYRTRVEAACTP